MKVKLLGGVVIPRNTFENEFPISFNVGQEVESGEYFTDEELTRWVESDPPLAVLVEPGKRRGRPRKENADAVDPPENMAV